MDMNGDPGGGAGSIRGKIIQDRAVTYPGIHVAASRANNELKAGFRRPRRETTTTHPWTRRDKPEPVVVLYSRSRFPSDTCTSRGARSKARSSVVPAKIDPS